MMNKRIFGYDFIRAVAILLVMIGHTLGYLYAGTYSFFFSFLSGFFGVELFFVLSGVLIGKLLLEVFKAENYPQRLKNFLIRRWMRTLPMYFIMLLVYWLGNRYFDSVHNQGVALWKYIFFLQNYYTVQPTFFGVSWSLSIEEWFYILFPLVLLMIKTGQPKLAVKKIFTIGVVIFVVYFLGMRFLALSENQYFFYEGVRKIAFFRLDAIAYGILLAMGFEYFGQEIRHRKNLFLWIGILIIVLNQVLIFRENYSHLNYFNTVYYSVLGIGLVLIFPFFEGIKNPKNLFGKGVTYISKTSYSLYLIHWLVYRFLELSVFQSIPTPIKFFLFLGLSFLLAGMAYTFIEKPIFGYREKIASREGA